MLCCGSEFHVGSGGHHRGIHPPAGAGRGFTRQQSLDREIRRVVPSASDVGSATEDQGLRMNSFLFGKVESARWGP